MAFLADRLFRAQTREAPEIAQEGAEQNPERQRDREDIRMKRLQPAPLIRATINANRPHAGTLRTALLP